MAPLLVVGGASPLIGAILALATTAILTGAIHLDAVADTADALMARDRAAAEQRGGNHGSGRGGALALVFVVALEAVALAEVASGLGLAGAWVVGVVACSASRGAPVRRRRAGARPGRGRRVVRGSSGRSMRSGGVVAADNALAVVGLAWAGTRRVRPWVALGGAASGFWPV